MLVIEATPALAPGQEIDRRGRRLVQVLALRMVGAEEFQADLAGRYGGRARAPAEGGAASRDELAHPPNAYTCSFEAGPISSPAASFPGSCGEANSPLRMVKAQVVVVGEARQVMFDPLEGSHFCIP